MKNVPPADLKVAMEWCKRNNVRVVTGDRFYMIDGERVRFTEAVGYIQKLAREAATRAWERGELKASA